MDFKSDLVVINIVLLQIIDVNSGTFRGINTDRILVDGGPKIELGARYRLTNDISVSSGVECGYLRWGSKSSETFNSWSTLGYLSIPVNLEYTVFN